MYNTFLYKDLYNKDKKCKTESIKKKKKNNCKKLYSYLKLQFERWSKIN